MMLPSTNDNWFGNCADVRTSLFPDVEEFTVMSDENKELETSPETPQT